MMRLHDGRFTNEQVAHFREEGYLIVENVFDPADLAPLRTELASETNRTINALAREGRVSETYANEPFERRLARIYHDSKENGEAVMHPFEGMRGGGYQGRAMFDLITHPKLLDVISDLVGPEIVASSAYRIRPKIPGVGRGNVPWHQDSGYFAPHCDEHLIVTCWIPLVNATVENGCMEILPRSHKTGILEHHTGGNMGLYVIKDDDLPSGAPERVVAECPLGGVVFMTNLTPHCSTPNTSDGIRWSVDLRYQSAHAPNNLGLWPDRHEADELANVQIACYPPEADFRVRSDADASSVVDYAGFLKRRAAYEPLNIGTPRVWNPVG
ncbi:MAG: phytanoyl-CoA dioxygenase family protein [Rubricoccaceae bacterium]